MTKQTALITGASAGIGRELALLFARDGHDVILVARSEGKLLALAEELRQLHGVQASVIAEDLSLPGAAERVVQATEGTTVDFLVNNAGFGVYGAFIDTDGARELEMIRLNVIALTELTKLYLPGMAERGDGRVLNVASTAAFQPGPGMAVYFATKAYVLSFSEAVAEEMRGTGVTVTALCPGATHTEFAAGARMEKSNLFQQPGIMDAATVAQEGYEAMMRGTVVAITGARNKVLAQSVRFVPRAVIRRLTRKLMEQRGR